MKDFHLYLAIACLLIGTVDACDGNAWLVLLAALGVLLNMIAWSRDQ